jgi:hypothetical protein
MICVVNALLGGESEILSIKWLDGLYAVYCRQQDCKKNMRENQKKKKKKKKKINQTLFLPEFEANNDTGQEECHRVHRDGTHDKNRHIQISLPVLEHHPELSP